MIAKTLVNSIFDRDVLVTQVVDTPPVTLEKIGNESFVTYNYDGGSVVAKEDIQRMKAALKTIEQVDRDQSPLKNLAAGIINSIVPGSNLGDSNSDFKDAGGIFGSVASLLVPGAGAVGTVSKLVQTENDVSLISNVINGAKKFLTSPTVGQIAGSILPFIAPVPAVAASLVKLSPPTAQPPQPIFGTQSAPSPAQAISEAAFRGIGGVLKVDNPAADPNTMPTWAKWALGAAAVVAFFLFGWLMFFKSSKR